MRFFQILVLAEASSSLEKSTNVLEDSIELVNKNILNIPKKLTEVGKDIKKEIEPAVRTAIEKSQNKLDTIDTVEKIGSKSVLTITKDFLEHFLKYNSMHGVIVSYCAYLSHKNKTPLIHDEIKKIIKGEYSYFKGQLIAQSSMGLFDHKVVEENKWIIEEYDEILAKIIHKTYKVRIEKFIKDNSEEKYMKGKEDDFRNWDTKLSDLIKK